MLAMTQILQLRHTVKFVEFLVWLSATLTTAMKNSKKGLFNVTTYWLLDLTVTFLNELLGNNSFHGSMSYYWNSVIFSFVSFFQIFSYVFFLVTSFSLAIASFLFIITSFNYWLIVIFRFPCLLCLFSFLFISFIFLFISGCISRNVLYESHF